VQWYHGSCGDELHTEGGPNTPDLSSASKIFIARPTPAPSRSQHDALDALVVGISGKKVNYILDAENRSAKPAKHSSSSASLPESPFIAGRNKAQKLNKQYATQS
jgi:hypothetical protein